MMLDLITQLVYLRREEEYLRMRVLEMESTLGAGSSLGEAGGGHASTPGDPTARQAIALSQLKDKYDHARARTRELIAQLEDYIARVPDARVRLALRLKYADGLSWRQTAREMDGREDTADALRVHVRRIVREMDEGI